MYRSLPRIHVVLVALTTALLLGNTARAAEKHAVDVQTNVVYGTGGGEDLTLHFARPTDADGPVPGLIFIHGGGWRMGSKNVYLSAIKQFAEQGYVCATVGYRFTPKHRFPSQIEDVKCAVRWMRAHADELGVDPRRIGATGASAGGHLAMILGVMDSEDGLEGSGGWADQSSKVQAVVSFYGPADLTLGGIEDSPAAGDFDEATARGILTDFVGGAPEDKQSELRLASPITYVNEGDAPMLLLQGTRDPLVPYDQAFHMATALTNAGVPGRVELIFGAEHGWRGEELNRTQRATLSFFDTYLKGK